MPISWKQETDKLSRAVIEHVKTVDTIMKRPPSCANGIELAHQIKEIEEIAWNVRALIIGKLAATEERLEYIKSKIQ